MKLEIKKGSVDQSLLIFISDSSSTTGDGLAGLVYNSTSLICYYARPLTAAAVLTLVTQTVTGAHADGGFVEIDSTNMPGMYRLDIPDALVATGVDSVVLMLSGATNMAPLPIEIQLVDNIAKDIYDISNNASYGNAQLVRSTTPANTLDVNATGETGIDLDNTSGTLAKTTDITGFNDIAATAIVSAGAITALSGAIANVDLVATTTTNTDMRGTDNALLATSAPTNFADMSITATTGRVDVASIGGTLQTANDNGADINAILLDTADIQPKMGTPATDISADIAAVKVDTAAVLVDTGNTLDTKLNDIQGVTFSSSTDSLEAIRDRGDAAWTTGAVGSDRLLMVDTTIATLASQTSFTLTAGSSDDKAYENCTIIIEDATTAAQKAIGVIDAYTGATLTVALKYDPAVFTMAATDKVYILAEKGLKTNASNRQISIDANGRIDIGSWLGTSVTISSTTAKPEVDAYSVSDDATSANNLELDYDGTGYNKSNSTIGTSTNNTDMRGTDNAALASAYTATRAGYLDNISAGAVPTAAQVNAEVLDVMQTDTFAELDAIPGATSSIKDKLTFLFMLARNQLEQTSTTSTLRADDTTTSVGTSAVADDGTTATKGEWL